MDHKLYSNSTFAFTTGCLTTTKIGQSIRRLYHHREPPGMLKDQIGFLLDIFYQLYYGS